MEIWTTKPDGNEAEVAWEINIKYDKCGSGDFCHLTLCCPLPSKRGDFKMGNPMKAEA